MTRRGSGSSAAAISPSWPSPGLAPRSAWLRARAAAGPVTLLTATRDVSHSQAAVLAELLGGGTGGPGSTPDELPGTKPGGPGSGMAPDEESDLGGDAACWAHLVCPECGAVTSEGHRPGCSAGPGAPGSGAGTSHGPFGSRKPGRAARGPGPCGGDRGTS